MFDTMTFTKILGGFCGALLVFLLGKWAAENVYAMGGGHGDDGHGAAYVIDTGGDGHGGGETEEEVKSFAELYAAADPDKGERVFNKCKACHAVEQGANGAGPYLYGVVGRQVDTAQGFGYSGALEQAADVWTPEALYGFLENPGGYAPGTTMGFAGLNKSEDRVNVIAYLDMTDGDMTEVAGAAMEESHSETETAAAEATEETAAEAVTAEEPTVAEPEPTAEAEAAAEAATEEAATEEAAAEETATEEAAAGGESGFAALVAAADPADGEKVFRKCQACHVADAETNRVGPHLVGIVGRAIGGVDGFNYSGALADHGGEWTLDNLNAWLEDPKGFAPGNKMSFRGLNSEEERAAVIAYMQSVGG